MPQICDIRQSSRNQTIFSSPPIFDAIYSCLTPRSLIRTGQTCTLVRRSVQHYSQRAFNINVHLSRYFEDPIGFRSLQARTGTVISGSNALQFLNRTFYPESDLDLYTHPGHSHEVGRWLQDVGGYTYIPRAAEADADDFDRSQNADFNIEVPNRWNGTASRLTLADNDPPDYVWTGIVDVYNFIKKRHGDEPLKVQIIASKINPVECVLQFHLTCVMNIIAFDAAYAFYPIPSFETRDALLLGNRNSTTPRAIEKYVKRGWQIKANVWPFEESTFQLGKLRWVNDRHSWVLPLDMAGIGPKPPPSAASTPCPWDPAIFNSWIFEREAKDDPPYARHFPVLRSTIFRYNYLIADNQFFDMLREFCNEQGRMSHVFTSDRSLWTWWDFQLPQWREHHAAQDGVI